MSATVASSVPREALSRVVDRSTNRESGESDDESLELSDGEEHCAGPDRVTASIRGLADTVIVTVVEPRTRSGYADDRNPCGSEGSYIS